LPAKTIFASPVFTMEKNGFYHRLAKTCQSCLLLLRFRYFVIAVLSPGVCVYWDINVYQSWFLSLSVTCLVCCHLQITEAAACP